MANIGFLETYPSSGPRHYDTEVSRRQLPEFNDELRGMTASGVFSAHRFYNILYYCPQVSMANPVFDGFLARFPDALNACVQAVREMYPCLEERHLPLLSRSSLLFLIDNYALGLSSVLPPQLLRDRALLMHAVPFVNVRLEDLVELYNDEEFMEMYLTKKEYMACSMFCQLPVEFQTVKLALRALEVDSIHYYVFRVESCAALFESEAFCEKMLTAGACLSQLPRVCGANISLVKAAARTPNARSCYYYVAPELLEDYSILKLAVASDARAYSVLVRRLFNGEMKDIPYSVFQECCAICPDVYQYGYRHFRMENAVAVFQVAPGQRVHYPGFPYMPVGVRLAVASSAESALVFVEDGGVKEIRALRRYMREVDAEHAGMLQVLVAQRWGGVHREQNAFGRLPRELMGRLMAFCGMTREYDMVPRAAKSILAFTAEFKARERAEQEFERAAYVWHLRSGKRMRLGL